jgi:hypothetical protein
MVASVQPVAMEPALMPIDQLLAGQLQDINQKPFELATLKGRPSVLYFGSIESADAVAMGERLNELAKASSQTSDAQIVALNQDIGTGKAHEALEIRVHAKLVDAVYPTLLDVDAQVAGRFNVKQPGEFVVMDAAGAIVYRGPFEVPNADGKTTDGVREALRRAVAPHRIANNQLASVTARP